jgi:hypothetical protein
MNSDASDGEFGDEPPLKGPLEALCYGKCMAHGTHLYATGYAAENLAEMRRTVVYPESRTSS